MASGVKFQQFPYDLCQKVHNFTVDTINAGLSNTAPVAASNKLWGDITEIAAGNGYAAGGASAAVSNTQSGGTFTLTGTNITWTCVTSAMAPFRYLVAYNTSTSPNNKPLIAYWDYGSALTLNPGDTFTVAWNGGASNGTMLTVA